MRRGIRLPLMVLAAAFLCLILLLATLQYVWLGRISEAERERLRATLASRAAEFAQDFDRELARAYLLFQTEPPQPGQDPSARFAERYDRWLATSLFPRLLEDFHVAARGDDGTLRLERFDPASRRLEPASWPASMADWRERFHEQPERRGRENLVIRRIPSPIWETVPALVVPAPMLFVSERPGPPFFPPELSYTLLTIDLDYVKRELLPSLAQRHFRKAGDESEYHVAVVESADAATAVYQSTPAFSPRGSTSGDASAGLFQVRPQEFGAVAAEVRRFVTFSTATSTATRAHRGGGRDSRITVRAPAQMSILLQQGAGSEGAGREALAAGRATPAAPRWRVVVKHPAGSLEAYVGSTRRRNLFVSTSILAILGASMALLIVSTRRSHELARQQLEFVAAVSHELRTPLAVIRSAGDNLADGVVHDEAQVRKYGDLIRGEGRRLSEMVEQILDLAGLQSGQRAFARRPVHIRPLIDEVLSASAAPIDQAGIRVEVDVPPDLPAVLGDDGALRRVFQNLIGNSIKYGASGGWIGIGARRQGSQVLVSVSDKGIGIAPAEQARIFEPFYRTAEVVAARIQGAGLGLSLVQRIVDGHGGRVTVRSAPGAGSEFEVALPAAGDPLAVAAEPAPGSPQTARSS